MKTSYLFTLLFLFLISTFLSAQEIRKINVGDHKLEVKIKEGGPISVVFEAGMTFDLSTWDPVYDIIGTFTTAVAYSRAGHGGSEEGPFPRTPERLFQDFNSMLDTLQLDHPIILVGHSWGGLLIRYYANLIPEKVGGIVLIDATHEDQDIMKMEADSVKWNEEYQKYLQFADSLKAAKSYPRSVFSENDVCDDILLKVVDFNIDSLPDIPTVVLTSVKGDSRYPNDKENWREMHSEWLQNKSNAIWIVTDRGGHFIHKDQPDLVVNAIKFINNILLADIKTGN